MSRTRMLVSGISAGLTVAGLAIVGAGGSAGAAVHPAVATSAVTTVPGSVPAFTRDTRPIGTMAASQRLSIQVWLQPRTAAATRFAQAVSTPGSPQFHRFAASQADASAVESWLRANGFTAVSTGPERSYVRATATVSTINRAFDVQLKLYKSSAAINGGGVNGGSHALWSNDRSVSLPANLASLVLAVTGLDSAAPVDPSAETQTGDGNEAAASKTPSAACSQYYGQHLEGGLPEHFGRTSFPTQVCGYSARLLRAAYGADMTNTGKGQTIAFVELGPAEPDLLLTLQDYAKVSGLPVPSSRQYAQVLVGKGCPEVAEAEQRPATGSALDVEEQMDVEAAYAMASYYPARHGHLDPLVGSIAPGRYADIVLLTSVRDVAIKEVFANGQLAAQDGKYLRQQVLSSWRRRTESTCCRCRGSTGPRGRRTRST